MQKHYIRKLMKTNRITIPKAIVKALNLDEYVILTMEKNKIILSPAKIVVADKGVNSP